MLSSTKSKVLIHYGLTILLLIVLAVSSWFLYSNFENVGDHEARVNNRLIIGNELDKIISVAADAETSVRGYLLTRTESFLTPYFEAQKNVWGHFSALKQRGDVYGDSFKPGELESLENILLRHFKALQTIVEKFKKSSTHEISERSLVLNKEIMDEARRQATEIKNGQNVRLQARSQLVQSSKLYFKLSLYGITILLSLLIISVSIRVAHNYQKIAEDSEAKVKDAENKTFASDISETLSGNIVVREAGLSVLKYFSKVFDVPAGRLFLQDNGKINHYVDLGVLDSGENLSLQKKHVGSNMSLVQSAFESIDIREIRNVPASYWSISSSLGQAVPTHIYFVPFTYENEVFGVLEIGTFSELTPRQKELLKSVQSVLGVGLNAALSREKLQDLLEKTQMQSEELQAQQEELRTSNEELEQQAHAMESQQEALNIKNQELQEAKRKLEEHTQELKHSNQYKSDFLARMSHELRTPLNGLLILSSLLMENKENNLTQRQLDFLLSIKNSGNDLLMIINDILDLSKIEARKLAIRPEKFALRALFESKTRNFKMQATSKGLEFITKLPESLKDLEIFTDRQRLDQILRNFLANALKFTESGSVTLEARLNHSTDRVQFIVEDTGIGIPPDKKEQIFNAFEQADSSTSRKYGGTGLGLTISQELAVLLGGDITLESTYGKGSKFILSLPKAYKKTEDGRESTSTPQRMVVEESVSGRHIEPDSSVLGIIQNLDKSKKTILVVEDDEKFRTSVVEVIRNYNFEPIEVADGEYAISLLKEYAPDAILLDVRLPGISGLGILEMVKRMPHLRHIPVHMISAFDHHQSALQMGAMGYLTKPVTIENIHDALDRIKNILTKNLRRVLLVEDDSTQRTAISELISDKDIEVVSAHNGKNAVNEIKKGGYDCVILDLKLPDMTGFEILSEINSLEVAVPPIIVYTGKDLSEQEEEYLLKYSESIVIKGARSPERLLDEVNLFLHRVESMLPEAKRQALNQMRSGEEVFKGKKILIADDDIRNVFALTSALENKGLEILVARNGFEAVDMVNSTPDIDVVLMDIMMPKMDGLEAIRIIRGNKASLAKNVPIIALTAKAMRGDHEKCMDAGASDYLPKPVNLENLMTVLKVWLTPRGFLS